MDDIFGQILCMMNPNTCGAILLLLIIGFAFYYLFLLIAQKINDKWPKYSILTIMIIETVVTTALSVGVYVLIENVKNGGGGGSSQSRYRSRR